MPVDFSLSPAGPEHAHELAATTGMGFESYRDWMPAGWLPPDHRLEILNIRARLGRRDTWCLLARTPPDAPAMNTATRAAPVGTAGTAGTAGTGRTAGTAAATLATAAATEAIQGTRPGAPAGHVALLPGTLREPPRRAVPGLASLWMLFVRPPYWGTGLAGRLHDLALVEARARGYDRIQLHTPEGQARARAFYERRGWQREGPPFEDPMLALRIVRYLRPLDP